MNRTGRLTNEDILFAYRETGSVWKAAKRLTCAGQTVHKKLRAMGVEVDGSGRAWSDEEMDELRRLVVELALPLLEVAHRLDRTYASVAVRASRLGIESKRGGPKKVPRGQGYDKASMKKHVKALTAGGLTLTKYIRETGLKIGPFVRSFQINFPDEWQAFVRTEYANVQPRICRYCETEFYPTNARQLSCTQRCGERRRLDESYFGGKRRETIGWDLGQCQLCGEKPKVGLSSHHVFGKLNDPDNTTLLALCRGCHDVVTRLSSRKWATDTAKLESLIHLVIARARGAEFMTDPRVLHVSVEVDEYDAEAFDVEDFK